MMAFPYPVLIPEKGKPCVNCGSKENTQPIVVDGNAPQWEYFCEKCVDSVDIRDFAEGGRFYNEKATTA